MSALSAFGTQLKMGRGNDVAPGGDTFDLIAGVSNIGGPGLALDTLDGTAHDSPNGVEEVVASIIRTGEVTIDINYDPNSATHKGVSSGGIDGLAYALMNRSKKNFQLIWPVTPSAQWAFKALVTAFEPGAPYDDLLTASVTLKVTGVPTLA